MKPTQPKKKEVKLLDIVVDEGIYPRKSFDPATVQEYAANLEQIEAVGNFISVSGDLTLLDGRHRYLAYRKRYVDDPGKTIPVYVYAAESEATKFAIAVELNSSHGRNLTTEEKKRAAIRLFSRYQLTLEEIARRVSTRKSLVSDWTKALREDAVQQQNEEIFKWWTACQTHEEIGKRLGLGAQTIRDRLEHLSTEKFLGTKAWKDSLYQDFDEEDGLKPIYNVWRYGKNTNEVAHFGNMDPRIIDRLVYLYTKPFDIVLDPFAGGGITIDICRKRLRRFWCSDRKPIIEREQEIRCWDVNQGAPSLHKKWAEVVLTFLDPPYWKQAEGKYSKDPEDLGNMPLEQFTKCLSDLVNDIAKRQSKGHIALMIQPTQWKSDEKAFTDHVFDMVRLADPKRLRLANRISCPLDTQQCTPPMVEWAKQNGELLVISREIIVWEVVG